MFNVKHARPLPMKLNSVSRTKIFLFGMCNLFFSFAFNFNVLSIESPAIDAIAHVRRAISYSIMQHCIPMKPHKLQTHNFSFFNVKYKTIFTCNCECLHRTAPHRTQVPLINQQSFICIKPQTQTFFLLLLFDPLALLIQCFIFQNLLCTLNSLRSNETIKSKNCHFECASIVNSFLHPFRAKYIYQIGWRNYKKKYQL